MRRVPGYQAYRDSGGGMDEGMFLACRPDAVAIVCSLIGSNDVTDDNADAYDSAVFAACESLSRGTGSFSIGSFSMSGQEGGTDAARAAAALHLSGSGLLWSGL